MKAKDLGFGMLVGIAASGVIGLAAGLPPQGVIVGMACSCVACALVLLLAVTE